LKPLSPSVCASHCKEDDSLNSLRAKLRLLLSASTLAFIFFLSVQAAETASGQAASPTRSIRNWTHCDGKTDDNAGVVSALAAAKNNAFTLVVDCPVFIHVGTDVRRPIYFEDGTTVQFTGTGLFKVDNEQIPTFVLVNTSKIRLLGWRVQYVGQLPVEQHINYIENGVPGPVPKMPSTTFTDGALTQWVTAHRGIHFVGTRAPWPGCTDTSAIFLLMGNTRDVEFRNMKLFVAPDAKGSHFIPMGFASIAGGNSNASIAHQLPDTSGNFSVPSNISFSDIDLDGYYMGWQGSFQNTVFEHIRAHRYGDLQDDQGGNVGGIGKWFAPPHLFYLNYDPKIPEVQNRQIRILDVIDYGNRVGVARDRGGSDSGSGFINSLKIGGIDSEVNGYKSYRPDGLLDLLTSTNLKISNVDATYDSSFLNNIYPAVRFPQAPYDHVTLENITLVDKAAATRQAPIWGTYSASNTQVNVKVTINQLAQAAANGTKAYAGLCPPWKGSNNKVDIQFIVSGAKYVQKCN
jgi:hypothetical protein